MTRLALSLAVGEWRAQPLRTSLSIAAIAIGVALGFAIHLVNAVALDHFTGGLDRLRGAADLSIVAADPSGFDESLYAMLAGRPAAFIDAASPVVERDVLLADDPTIALHVAGLDALRAIRVTPLAVGRPDAGGRDTTDDPSVRTAAWFDPDAIHVPQALLAATGKHVGDPLTLRVDGELVTLRIAGLVGDDDAQPSAGRGIATGGNRRTFRVSMDIAGAQWRLHRLGRLSRIDLRVKEGADVARLRDALAPLLPGNAHLAAAADDRERSGDLSRAYRVNLDMLALMALFTGAFLVFSTQSLAVARRRAQLALLRVVGATGRRVVGQILFEGLVQGIIGGACGLAAGIGVAALALRFFGGDLGGGYFGATDVDVPALVVAAPEAALLFFALGLGAALGGSFIPARAAARTPPAAALKSADDAGASTGSPRTAALLLVAGLGCALTPAWNGLPVGGYVAMALLLFGGIAAMPWVARALLSPFARRAAPRSIAVDLALRRLWAAPSAASVALCGIVASASLMVAMTVMIASFRDSVDAWLGELLSADLYVRTDPSGDGIGPDDEARLARVGGVRRVDLQKVVAISLDATKPSVALIARTVDTGDPSRSMPLTRSTRVPADAVPVWVSEAMVDLYGARLGEPLALPLGDTHQARRFVVAGIWRDYARQLGSVIVRRDDYTRATGDRRFSDAAVLLDHAVPVATVIRGLRDALPGSLRARAEFAEPGAIRALSLRIFDRSFAVTYLLQAVAIAIGLAGVAATFSAQTLARAREFGMLRHIGVAKRQIVGELATEGALLGLVGAIAGGLLGLAMSQVLIHVVNPQSFHWTMDTTIPWPTTSLVGAALLIAAAGTAMLAGRRALGRDAILAVREDW